MSQTGAFQRAQTGTQGQQAQANIANQAAQLGISTAELQARLGQQAFSTAQSQGQAGMQAGRDIGSSAAQRGQLGMQGIGAQIGAAGQRADIGQGMASQYGQAQQMGMGSYEDQMRRMQGAARGMGGQTQQQYGTALKHTAQVVPLNARCARVLPDLVSKDTTCLQVRSEPWQGLDRLVEAFRIALTAINILLRHRWQTSLT